MLLLALLLSGCAELPPCPKAHAAILQNEEGKFYLGFDTENMALWIESIRKEALGECVSRKKGTEL